ncbi:hypothetical protein F5Y02DRAFT_422479 [Annulohypoxylon stygium]|nr:hypothetical protein F5Y02DRAFT_422479 [Annulohypoxylon stygium]
MVSSLGTSPFVKQAILTDVCQIPLDGVNSRLNISRNFTGLWQNSGKSLKESLEFPNLQDAAASSLFQDITVGKSTSLAMDCPTGNCTFSNSGIDGIYSTLGICSSCIDTSSLISSFQWGKEDSGRIYYFGNNTLRRWNYSDPNNWTNYTLPNGMSIMTKEHFTGLTVNVSPKTIEWTGNLLKPEMKALSQWAIANINVLTSNWHEGTKGFTEYISVTCSLYPCLRSYRGSVTNGVLNESLINAIPAMPNVIDVFPPNITIEEIYNATYTELYNITHSYYPMLFFEATKLQAIQSPCLVGNTIWTHANTSPSIDSQPLLFLRPDVTGKQQFIVENTTAPKDCIFSMGINAWSDFCTIMKETFSDGSCYVQSLPPVGRSLQCTDKFWLAGLYSDEGITVSGLVRRIEDYTDRLSDKLRMGLLNNPSQVFGQVLYTTVCTNVDYRWLLFPTALVAVTGGLLLWSLIHSWRYRGRELLWKSSVLPFLLYGERFIVQNGEDVSGGSSDSLHVKEEKSLNLSEMESEAKQRKVRFRGFDH